MIDARAVIAREASLAEDVTVGPYTVIGPDVEIGAGTHIGAHVVISGPTRIGRDNRIYPFASLGEAPQDKKYRGEPTRLEIGDRNTLREYVTVNRGTAQDSGITRIGADNWIMAYVHIAHDCDIGNHTIFANAASLAGHVTVGDYCVLGGFSLVVQFCRLGAHCFTMMASAINRDVPPYISVAGYRAKPVGINVEGLKRRGFSPAAITELRRAYKILYKSGLRLEQAIEKLRMAAAEHVELVPLLEFLETSERGIVR